MKKLIALLLLAVSITAFAVNTNIRESMTNGRTYYGRESFWMEVKGEQILPTASVTWYADSIAGFSSVSLYGMEVSTGNRVTVDVTPVYSTGDTVSANSQVLTDNASLTTFYSPFYKFVYTNPTTATMNVTFNFMVTD
jgi:hypothetical protein